MERTDERNYTRRVSGVDHRQEAGNVDPWFPKFCTKKSKGEVVVKKRLKHVETQKAIGRHKEQLENKPWQQMKKQKTGRGKDRMRSWWPQQRSGMPHCHLKTSASKRARWRRRRSCTMRHWRTTSCRRRLQTSWKTSLRNSSGETAKQRMELSDLGDQIGKEEDTVTTTMQDLKGTDSRWSTTTLATICRVRDWRHNGKNNVDEAIAMAHALQAYLDRERHKAVKRTTMKNSRRYKRKKRVMSWRLLYMWAKGDKLPMEKYAACLQIKRGTQGRSGKPISGGRGNRKSGGVQGRREESLKGWSQKREQGLCY